MESVRSPADAAPGDPRQRGVIWQITDLLPQLHIIPVSR